MKKLITILINSCESCKHCYVMNENTAQAKNMCKMTDNEVPRRHRIADDCPLPDRPEPEPIYTVTTLQFANPTRSLRCVGWYRDIDKAKDLIENNRGDIAEEGYYRYVVIEEKPFGIYTIPTKEWWYLWDRKKKKYFLQSSKPEKLKNVVCFGIG